MDRYTAGQIANHDFGEFITLDETFVKSEDVAGLEIELEAKTYHARTWKKRAKERVKERNAKIAELEEKLVAKQHAIDVAVNTIVAQRESKADAIREMLVAMKEVSSGVGYGIVIQISDIEEYVNNLEKE